MQKALPAKQVPVGVVNAIVIILRLFMVIRKFEAKRIKERAKRKKAAEDKIRNDHKIKSLFWPFFNEHI